jgi:hypothetical protein
MITMKKWYQSKTVWINILSLLAAITASLMSESALSDYIPIIIILNTTINIILRFMSSDKLEM